jgi:aspartyl aminopeptidase
LIDPPIFFFIDDEIVGSVSRLGVSLNFIEGVLRPLSFGEFILPLKLG